MGALHPKVRARATLSQSLLWRQWTSGHEIRAKAQEANKNIRGPNPSNLFAGNSAMPCWQSSPWLAAAKWSGMEWITYEPRTVLASVFACVTIWVAPSSDQRYQSFCVSVRYAGLARGNTPRLKHCQAGTGIRLKCADEAHPLDERPLVI